MGGSQSLDEKINKKNDGLEILCEASLKTGKKRSKKVMGNWYTCKGLCTRKILGRVPNLRINRSTDGQTDGRTKRLIEL